MTKLYLVSGFSLNMIDYRFGGVSADIRMLGYLDHMEFERWATARNCEVVSAVGHESTAKRMSEILGIDVKVNRQEVKMEEGDKALIFQIMQRLPEGKVLRVEELRKMIALWFVVEVKRFRI